MLIPIEQSSYHNDGFLRSGEIVSGAEAEGAPNDWILATLRVSHIARYAPSLRLCYNPIIRRHYYNLTVQMVLFRNLVTFCALVLDWISVMLSALCRRKTQFTPGCFSVV